MMIDIGKAPHIQAMARFAQPTLLSKAIERALPSLALLHKTALTALENNSLADAKYRRNMDDLLNGVSSR